MITLIVSANPLFSEAISAALSDRLDCELVFASPGEAMARIQDLQPDALLIDDAISPAVLGEIFKLARHLVNVRLILLNSTDNDLTVLDPLPASLEDVKDLLASLQADQGESRSDLPIGETSGFVGDHHGR
jgi:DNA-binding NarL/FixJ family response regulator